MVQNIYTLYLKHGLQVYQNKDTSINMNLKN